MITQHAWMFLGSYEKLREKLLQNNDIVNMAHLGARAFEEIGGEVVFDFSLYLAIGYLLPDVAHDIRERTFPALFYRSPALVMQSV